MYLSSQDLSFPRRLDTELYIAVDLKCLAYMLLLLGRMVFVWWQSSTYAPSPSCARLVVIVHVRGDQYGGPCIRTL